MNDTADNLYGAKIRPKSYALRQSVWKPYEFELGDHDGMADRFFITVQQLVQQLKLENYIGLRRYSLADSEELEITERKGVSVKILWDSVMSIIIPNNVPLDAILVEAEYYFVASNSLGIPLFIPRALFLYLYALLRDI